MKNSNKSALKPESQTNFSFFTAEKKKSAFRAYPFIKWAGGKSSLMNELKRRVPSKYKNYYEPFAGGAALFFDLVPEKSCLNDENEELINTYNVIKKDVKKLIKALKDYKYEEELYYKVRDLDKTKKFKSLNRIKKAARFIYLNKTCFNGLYRVNSKGEFNVPFGKYTNPKILDETNLLACSKALKKTKLTCGSYKKILSKVKKGDFVYLDPPYMPLSKTSNFTSYTKNPFKLKEQKELRDFCKKLDKKGAKFMLSNSSHPEIISLYKGYFVEFVKVGRAINSKAEGRGKIEEVIVRNYI